MTKAQNTAGRTTGLLCSSSPLKASQIMCSNGGNIIHSEILGEHGTELSKELKDIHGNTHTEN